MNKSLAERISEHTRQDVENLNKERRKQNKAKALKILTEEFTEMANSGREIFTDCSGKLDIYFYERVMDKMSSAEDAETALKDIGFEFITYPMGTVLVIPSGCQSVELRELLNTYTQLRNRFETGQRLAAEAHCKAVLQKLEAGDYKIVGIDEITVDFWTTSSTELYKSCITEMMKTNGFDVNISETSWDICIIRNGDE